MPENPRIEELRRRVQKDKASIAFAQLAEEYRRAGRFEEAIETCRTGLSHHPGYLSAHVTLGRALIEVGQLQPAQDELKRVLAAAPENLAALKGLADIHHRRGEQQEALVHYRRALELAPHDPDLEHLVAQIARELAPAHQPDATRGGLSFEEAVGEFLALEEHNLPVAVAMEPAEDLGLAGVPVAIAFERSYEPEPVPEIVMAVDESLATVAVIDTPIGLAVPIEPALASSGFPAEAPETAAAEEKSPPHATMQVEALERWLDAILADRQKRQQ